MISMRLIIELWIIVIEAELFHLLLLSNIHALSMTKDFINQIKVLETLGVVFLKIKITFKTQETFRFNLEVVDLMRKNFHQGINLCLKKQINFLRRLICRNLMVRSQVIVRILDSLKQVVISKVQMLQNCLTKYKNKLWDPKIKTHLVQVKGSSNNRTHLVSCTEQTKMKFLI